MENSTHFIEYYISKSKKLNNHRFCYYNVYPHNINLLDGMLYATGGLGLKTVAVIFIRPATTPLAERLAARGLMPLLSEEVITYEKQRSQIIFMQNRLNDLKNGNDKQ